MCAVAALALAAASLPATAQMPQGGAGGPARQDMQRCVGGVLSQLARSQSPETLVGPTVVSRCDRQLRAALQESIKTGEAGNCTVDSCLASARQRASGSGVPEFSALSRIDSIVPEDPRGRVVTLPRIRTLAAVLATAALALIPRSALADITVSAARITEGLL